MSVNMGTAVGYLDLDTKGFTSGFSTAAVSMKSFFSQESTFSGRLQSLGNAMSSVGSTLTKTVTVAVAGAGVAIVKAGSDFEAAMSQIAATKGTTVDAIQDIQEKAIEMGSTTSFSATEAAEGLNILAMAGLDTEESIAVIPDVLNLAAAGCIDMESAASYVTGAIKGFNDSMENSQYYADLMAKGASLANTDVNGLGEALSNASSNANSYGQNVEDTTVALLRLAEQNVTGAEASNALSRAMADLYTPTDSASKALKELGVSAYDESGAARDVNEVIDDLNASLSGMTDEQANAYKNTIFSTFGLKAFNKMTVSSADKVQSFRDELSTASDTLSGMGSAYDMSQTQLDNLQGSVTLFKSALEGLEIRLYNLKNEGLKSIVDFATGVLDKLNSLDEGTLELIEKIALVAAAIGPALILGGKITSLIGIISGNFANLQSALSGLSFEAISSGFTTLITTIGGLVAIIAIVVAAVAGFKAAWDEDFNNIRENTQSIFDNISTIFNTFSDAVFGVISTIADAWNNDWNGMRTTVESLISNVVALVSTLVSIITGIITTIRSMWDSNFLGMQTIVTTAFSVIGAVISTFLQTISGVISAITQLLNGDFAGAWETLKSTFSNLVGNIGSILSSLWSIIKTVFSNILSTVGTILGNLVSKAKEKITEFAEKIKEGAKSAVTKFIEFIKQLPSKVAYYLGYVIGKAVLFVTQFPAKAKEAGSKFLEKLINFVKQIPGKVKSWLDNVIDKAKDFATTFPAKAKKAAKDFLDKLIEKMKELPGKVKEKLDDVVEKVKELPDKFKSAAKDTIKGFINGIKEKWEDCKKAISDFAGNVVSGFKDALGIASPSKVMKKQVGEQIANGVIAGIDAKVKAGKIKAKEYSESLITAAESKLDALETYNKISTKKEAAYWKTILKKMKKGTSDYLTVYKKYIQSIEDANSEAYSNAETKLSNYKVYYDTSYKYEMDYWNKVRKQFKKGTQERIDADEKYLEAKQNYYDAIKELDEQYLEDQQEIYDTLKDDIQDLMDAYNDALESRTNAIMDSFKLFDSYTQKDAVTAQTLIENLQSQEEAMQLYTDNLNALYARELPEDFLESIKDMGVDATQNIIALNSMTDEELSNYVLRWQELNKQAKEQATVDLSGLREETVTQIEELTKTADDKLAELSETYEKNLEDLGTTAKKAAATAGTNTTKALAKAVKSGTSEVVANVKTLKELMLKQLNAIDTKVQSIASGLQESISSMVELQELKDAQAASSSDSYSGSHANGLDYVPYDGYIARLHKGEAVLTAEENRNKSSVSEGNSFYFYGTPPLDEKETARQMKLAQQQLAMGF